MTELRHWKTLERRLLIDRLPWMRIFEDDVALPDGRTVQGYLRIETPGYAMVVAVDSEGRVGFIRSYKRGVDDIDLQPPAGVLDPDEEPLACAQRELIEELGCRAEQLHPLGTFVLNGNYHAGQSHMFLATGCQQVAVPNAGDLEEQQIVWLPYVEVRQRWATGAFRQLSSTAALGLGLDLLERLVASGELRFGART